MTRLIDADAFIEENQEIIDCEIDHPKYQDTLRELINNAPTVERPHGTWRMAKGQVDKAICEHCGMLSLSIVEPFEKPPYCQWCGASMVKEGEAND